MTGRSTHPVCATVKSGLCIGCGACCLVPWSDEVTLAESPQGFLEPQAPASSPSKAEMSLFREVCPGRGFRGTRSRNSVLWGPVVGSYSGHATNAQLRYVASSGGLLTAVCSHMLTTGKVDAVLALHSDPTDPLRPKPHVFRTSDELIGAAGSRYCPSSPISALANVKPEERVAFVGKPCDIAAVTHMTRAGIGPAQHVEVTLSFFCAGIPSYHGTNDLLTAMGVQPTEVREFRYRGHGWPGSCTARTDDREASCAYEESWGRVLARCRHERCKICADGTGELADISFGDAWHQKPSGAPSFEEANGLSLAIARSQEGHEILSRAQAAGAIALKPTELAVLESIQPGQVDRKCSVAARLVGRGAMGASIPRYWNLGLLRASLRLGARELLAQAHGAAARAARSNPRRFHRWLRGAAPTKR